MKKLFIFALFLLIATGVFAQTVIVAVDYAPSVYYSKVKGFVDSGFFASQNDNMVGFEVKGTYLKDIGKMGVGGQFTANLGFNANPSTITVYSSGSKRTDSSFLGNGNFNYTLNFNGLFVFAPVKTESAILSVGVGLNWLTFIHDVENDNDDSFLTGAGIVGAVDINIFFTKYIGLNLGFEAAYELSMTDDEGEVSDMENMYAAMSFGLALRF